MKPLASTTPHVIVMVGIPGSGKTTFAEHFAKTFHAPFINIDSLCASVDLSTKAGVVIATKFLDELLKTQRTIVFEGGSGSRVERQALTRRITAAGYEPLLVWVQTETAEAKRRSLRKRAGYTPLDESAFEETLRRFTPPTAREKAVVISGKHTYSTQVKAVLKQLAGPKPEIEEKAPSRQRSGRNIFIR
jgi:shikimate kinase